jgi:pimeloyl-ACP methyl ester carboxylesterase
MFETVEIAASDGRRLEVQLAGPEDGQALIFHVGTPSAGRLFAPMVEAGSSRGVRHITYSRPGYGSSQRHAGRSVADGAADVAAIADELEIDRFMTAGWSGGGPHALACAALLGERVIAAASMAGVAPFHAEGLDWLDGMGQENLDEFGATAAGDAELVAYLEGAAPSMAAATGADLLAGFGDLISEVDRKTLTGDFAEYFATSTSAAVENGIWGWFDDDIAFYRDWGFDLRAMSRPVTIWQGGEDRFVPYAHGKWLAGNVAGARAQLHPEHGHLSLGVDSYGEILDELLARAR